MTEPNLEPKEARQGETGFGVRWVLILSTIATVIAFGVLAAVML